MWIMPCRQPTPTTMARSISMSSRSVVALINVFVCHYIYRSLHFHYQIILLSHSQRNLGDRGRAEAEVQALFAKYDLDGNRVLDASEQKLLESDMKVRFHGLPCLRHQLSSCVVLFFLVSFADIIAEIERFSRRRGERALSSGWSYFPTVFVAMSHNHAVAITTLQRISKLTSQVGVPVPADLNSSDLELLKYVCSAKLPSHKHTATLPTSTLPALHMYAHLYWYSNASSPLLLFAALHAQCRLTCQASCGAPRALYWCYYWQDGRYSR